MTSFKLLTTVFLAITWATASFSAPLGNQLEERTAEPGNPDWKRGAAAPDWKRGAAAPDWKREAAAPDWKREASAPDWKREASPPDWKRGVGGYPSSPDWKRKLESLD